MNPVNPTITIIHTSADNTPMLDRLNEGDMYVFGTPDPYMFYAGKFHSKTTDYITMSDVVLMRIVMNGTKTSLNMTVPGEVMDLKPKFYTVNRIGITYAAPFSEKVKAYYTQVKSNIIIPPPGASIKPFESH